MSDVYVVLSRTTRGMSPDAVFENEDTARRYATAHGYDEYGAPNAVVMSTPFIDDGELTTENACGS